MDELTAELWRGAKTASEIGELTVRRLEKRLPSHPCYDGSPDEETESIQKHLINFNRNGLVTTFSQPAENLDEEGDAQRAAVEGFAEEIVAKKIAALGLYTDLLVFIYPPGVQWGYQIPITIREFHPYAWLGPGWGFEDFDCFAEHCSKAALKSLKTMWKVVIIDLQWGREEYLWQLANGAITGLSNKPFHIASSPEHKGNADFVY